SDLIGIDRCRPIKGGKSTTIVSGLTIHLDGTDVNKPSNAKLCCLSSKSESAVAIYLSKCHKRTFCWVFHYVSPSSRVDYHILISKSLTPISRRFEPFDFNLIAPFRVCRQRAYSKSYVIAGIGQQPILYPPTDKASTTCQQYIHALFRKAS